MESFREQWTLLSKWAKGLIFCGCAVLIFGFCAFFWNRERSEVVSKRETRSEHAQRLLVEGKGEEAERIASKLLEELHALNPDYAEFSKITFLIEQKKNEEAFERSSALQKGMKNKNSVLYARNLLRIAFLQQNWNEWEEFAQQQPSLARSALKGFENRIRFQTYIDLSKK